MGLEEDLFEAMKYMSFGDKASGNKVFKAIITNTQIGALKHLRDRLDELIAKLNEQEMSMGDMGDLDPFSILGVSRNATKEQVRKAFREKAKKAHPDAGGSNEDMIKINAAWEAIKRFKGWK